MRFGGGVGRAFGKPSKEGKNERLRPVKVNDLVPAHQFFFGDGDFAYGE